MDGMDLMDVVDKASGRVWLEEGYILVVRHHWAGLGMVIGWAVSKGEICTMNAQVDNNNNVRRGAGGPPPRETEQHKNWTALEQNNIRVGPHFAVCSPLPNPSEATMPGQGGSDSVKPVEEALGEGKRDEEGGKGD
jgi:hypothetical protein